MTATTVPAGVIFTEVLVPTVRITITDWPAFADEFLARLPERLDLSPVGYDDNLDDEAQLMLVRGDLDGLEEWVHASTWERIHDDATRTVREVLDEMGLDASLMDKGALVELQSTVLGLDESDPLRDLFKHRRTVQFTVRRDGVEYSARAFEVDLFRFWTSGASTLSPSWDVDCWDGNRLRSSIESGVVFTATELAGASLAC